MSNPSEPFECQWQASRLSLVSYLVVLGSALLTLLATSEAPGWLRVLLGAGCALHAAWVLPRHVLWCHPTSWTRLRHDQHGWHLWSQQAGWQPVQLRRDSMALPLAIILRFRLAGSRLTRSVCLPGDALPAEQHRRLRVRLKFSRQRWKAPE